MPDSKPPPMTRRSLLVGAAAAPVASVYTPRSPDLTVRCAEWLAMDFEIDRLSLRWSRLETVAVRTFGWLQLSAAERLTMPLAAEMAENDGVRLFGYDAADRLRATSVNNGTISYDALGRLRETPTHLKPVSQL